LIDTNFTNEDEFSRIEPIAVIIKSEIEHPTSEIRGQLSILGSIPFLGKKTSI
jgi:hypothetical protein